MILRLALLLMGTALLLRADDAAEKLTSAGITEFNAAFQAWDGGRFWNAAELFKKAAAKSPDSSVNYYWLGAARFHRMLYFRSLAASEMNTSTADAERDQALEALEMAVKLNGRDAESHALIGTLYGMKIDGMIDGIRYGRTLQEHQKQAIASGADNPRVQYLLGTGLFHTAKDDADRREALKTLLAAEKLFVAEQKKPAKPFDPRWGGSSCLTFIGRTYASLGHKSEAVDYFRKALAEHPADHVAKAELARLASPN